MYITNESWIFESLASDAQYETSLYWSRRLQQPIISTLSLSLFFFYLFKFFILNLQIFLWMFFFLSVIDIVTADSPFDWLFGLD